MLVRDGRKRAGLTQRALADAVGVDFTYVSKIERDRLLVPPSWGLLVRMADVMGTDRWSLLGASGRCVAVPIDVVMGLRDAFATRDAERALAWAKLVVDRLGAMER